jgi:inhibitor of cysteine peptidase
MDERKIFDMIKKSGENVDAPEEIQPEQIRRLLEEQLSDKKKRFRRYAQWGAVAAVFALVIIGGVTGLTRLSGTDGKEHTETGSMVLSDATQQKETETMQLAEQNSEAVKETVKETTKETEASVGSDKDVYVFAGAKNYQQVFDALKSTQNDREYATADLARGVTTEMAVEDSAASMMDMGSSASNTGAALSYSKTNLQEAGVDEADIIKTDGKYLYVMKATGSVRMIRAEGKTLEVEGTIMLEALNETPQEMYVDGDILNLIVTGSRTTLDSDDTQEDTYTANTENYTKIYTYDISDRSVPQLRGTVKQKGTYSTSRKNGDVIYLFTQFYPQINDADQIDTYVPAVNGARLESTDIYLPEYQNSSSYLVISSVSNRRPDEVIDKKAIVSAADNFYVSNDNIYIANANWSSDTAMTQILKFSCQKGKIRAKGAADLKGFLNDSFSMNEYNGYIRIVLTDYSGDTQTNALYVLDDALEVCGSITDIAEGEEIRSARFLGDTGYFVTFKETDPLFSVDLSDPAEPKVLGELKITGFSSYLHFYGENKLLGVGNEVDPETGAYTGIKLAMFDVSDPSNVKQLHKFVIKDTYDCPLFYNYKAAMIDTEKNIFGFMCDSSYMIFRYDEEKGFENIFTENLGDSYYSSSYNGTQGIRGCFIDNSFYLIGGGQIRIYDMADDYKEVGRLEL